MARKAGHAALHGGWDQYSVPGRRVKPGRQMRVGAPGEEKVVALAHGPGKGGEEYEKAARKVVP